MLYPTQKRFLPFTTSLDHPQYSLRKWNHLEQSTSEDSEIEINSKFSPTFTMNPDLDEADQLLNSLGITDTIKKEQLRKLPHQVVEWNKHLNLISRKECTPEVVFGRHVLPSIALSTLPDFLPPSALEQRSGEDDPNAYCPQVVDVGTGGGFPGVPLAIIYPGAQFLLVDSVGKKLKAVEDMVNDLGLMNVRTHHGRVEEIIDDPKEGRSHIGCYDICVGRSVTALPRFCFWIQDLLKRGISGDKPNQEGKLVYIIGGEIEPLILSRVASDTPINNLIGIKEISDKRALVINGSDVIAIAAESGETKPKRGLRRNKSKQRKNTNNAKGSWKKRNNSSKKERGYDNFQRYN